jgi:hypothetical protein
MNPATLNQTMMLLQSSICDLQCNAAKMAAIQQEVACVQSISQTITYQASLLSGVFQQVFNAGQQQMQAYQQRMTDNDTKMTQINNLLNGSQDGQGNSAGGGLLAQRQATRDALAQLPAAILGFQNDYQQNVQATNSLQSFVQTRTAGLMMSCFNSRPVSNYQCVPNGPPVSAAEYLQCRYQQSHSVGSNGVLDQNKLVTGQAQAGSQGLAALIGQITGDAASDADVPDDPSKLVQKNSNAMRVANPTDVNTYYGNQLSGYKINGVSAQQFVSSMMNYCYSIAQSTVAAEQANPASAIGVQQYHLQTQKRKIQADITQQYNALSALYTENMSALTQQNVPMNAPACLSGQTQTQLNCLQNVQREMQGLLNGTAQDSGSNINIQGSISSSEIPCRGLNGCITALQNANRTLTSNQKTMEASKSQYVVNYNQMVESYTRGMAQQVSGVSTALQMRVDALNLALRSVGQSPLGRQTVRSEPFQQDPATGLDRPPASVLGALVNNVTPPLIDTSASGFLGGAGAANSNINAQYQQAQQQLIMLQNLVPTCIAQQKEQIGQQVLQASATARNCVDTDLCRGNQAEILNAINSVSMQMGNTPSLMNFGNTLISGHRAACQDNVTPTASRAFQEWRALGENSKLNKSTQDQKFFELKQELKLQQSIGNIGGQGDCVNFLGSLLGAKQQLEMVNHQFGGSVSGTAR